MEVDCASAARLGGVHGQIGSVRDAFRVVAAVGVDRDPHSRALIAEAHVLTTVRKNLIQRVAAAARAQKPADAAGGVLKLFTATTAARIDSIAMELARSESVVSNAPALDAARYGVNYLARQTTALGGGSNEMQRNSVSERVLGMPRDKDNRDRPFSQVRKNQPK